MPARLVGGMLAALALLGTTAVAAARDPGDPIALDFVEGDIAGFARVVTPGDREPLGMVEFHQRRDGDRLHMRRVSRFRDGSVDEDEADARVDGTLATVGGRSVIRDAHGGVVVDLAIDVAGGRIHGASGSGDRWDERVALPPATYFGPLVFLVLKNFARNAEDDRVVFRTVAPTPAPRVLDLEIVHLGRTTIERAGGPVSVERYALRPHVHWTIDPLLRLIAPDTEFFVAPGSPPALARFSGPRNYAGQEIWLE
jgi:hypothetical protein